ncbi:MAG TPA: type II toxin-antitoxin system VapC family toxin [Polyangiaceae bacterium]
MDYLIDTCILSEFTKPRPALSVDHWVAATPEAAQFVSVLTLGELEKGIHKLPASRRREMLERWLVELRARFSGRILDVSEAVALEWGRVSARAEKGGQPVPVIDAFLGATALVHDLVVVTRNSSDIDRTGAKLLDPWQERDRSR